MHIFVWISSLLILGTAFWLIRVTVFHNFFLVLYLNIYWRYVQEHTFHFITIACAAEVIPEETPPILTHHLLDSGCKCMTGTGKWKKHCFAVLLSSRGLIIWILQVLNWYYWRGYLANDCLFKEKICECFTNIVAVELIYIYKELIWIVCLPHRLLFISAF